MKETFQFNSVIKDTQNKLISQSIRETSNLEFLNSEEAIKNVIKSYTDKFSALGDNLVDINNYIVKSKDVIDVKLFNDLFESIYINFSAVYKDIENVSSVLDLNLQRNKNYFLVIKKRIRDLWNKLQLSRSYIHDSNPSSESYYESFSTDINIKNSENLMIDKKNGYLYINPFKLTTNNKSFQIKNITSVTYPEPNEKGGVFRTTNTLNTFVDNYTIGPRDMLQNGLWKEEILTNVAPELFVNIASPTGTINRKYNGIVSLIDIEYTYPIEFNRIDFDFFGDKPTIVDAILYKDNYNDVWKVLNFIPEDPLLDGNEYYDLNNYSVRGSNFDTISFFNINKVKTKYLRIVVNQENYNILNSTNNEILTLENKINKDLSERRYELLKFNNNIDGFLSSPENDENKSLYNKIINIIDSTSSIEKILRQIEELLVPKTKVIDINFSDFLKYEIGLWSIEPKIEIYNNKGNFNSIDFYLTDKCLSHVSLNTKQSNPDSCCCNWYINLNNSNIPILEENSVYRKEPINPIDLSSFPNFSGWSDGVFISLDFPIDIKLYENIGIYTNGTYRNDIYNRISFLNSKLLFLHGINDPFSANYVIRYPVSRYSSVNLYSLVPKVTTITSDKTISLGLVSSRRNVLEAFINEIKYYKQDGLGNLLFLKDSFVISDCISTMDESLDWFGTDFNKCISIDHSITSIINTSSPEYSKYESAILINQTKLLSTYSDSLLYLSGDRSGYRNLELMSSLCNISPINF